MGQALYRKHRPKSLDEVIGQEHITKTLAEALKQGRISHAYLFTGPRGTGKTSIARILAHEINGLPYTDDSTHLDIIEIDAASNRRIDEIRELRDKVYVAPTSAKYKVYIIDEVHMLTKEAFNALLKTLEEPPAHVVFMLATTDAHKLPATIISRTQRFSLKPVAQAKVIEHLRSLATAEAINIDDQALALLAEHGEGSFRDSISLLDQAGSGQQQVSLETVQSLLGLAPANGLEALRDSLASGQTKVVAQALNDLYDQGYQAASIAKQLGQVLRTELINNPAPIIRPTLLLQLLDVPQSHDPERLLEIILLENTLPTAWAQPPAIAQPAPKSELKTPVKLVTSPPEVITETSPESVSQASEALEPVPAEPQAEAPTAPTPAPKAKKSAPSGPQKPLSDSSWPDVLNALKGNHNTLYGIVRMAQPKFDDGHLTLAFAFPFHQKRLNEARNQLLLHQVIEQLTGQAIEIECIVDTAAKAPVVALAKTPLAAPPAPDPALSTISNIFGGGELLE